MYSEDYCYEDEEALRFQQIADGEEWEHEITCGGRFPLFSD